MAYPPPATRIVARIARRIRLLDQYGASGLTPEFSQRARLSAVARPSSPQMGHTSRASSHFNLSPRDSLRAMEHVSSCRPHTGQRTHIGSTRFATPKAGTSRKAMSATGSHRCSTTKPIAKSTKPTAAAVTALLVFQACPLRLSQRPVTVTLLASCVREPSVVSSGNHQPPGGCCDVGERRMEPMTNGRRSANGTEFRDQR